MRLNKLQNQKLDGTGLRIGIVFSRFNDSIGNKLLENTVENLVKNKVPKKNIDIFKVPGALEIPLTAKILIEKKLYDVIIALGIILKGKTYHFELVSRESHRALMDLSLQSNFPVVFGILAVNTKHQALERVEKSKLNKGKEFAQTAIESARHTKLLRKS